MFLSIIIALCWGFFAFCFIYRFVEKSYIYPLKYKEEILEKCDKYDLDVYLVYSIIKTESGFNRKAKSNKGAKGLMQITDDTATFIANNLKIEKYDLYNAETNIEFGCYYFKYLFNKFLSIDTSIVAYNAGEGNVSIWLNDKKYSDDGITLKGIPFNESKNYLEKITKNYKKYKNLYMDIVDKK